jgi:hypothetical protein
VKSYINALTELWSRQSPIGENPAPNPRADLAVQAVVCSAGQSENNRRRNERDERYYYSLAQLEDAGDLRVEAIPYGVIYY